MDFTQFNKITGEIISCGQTSIRSKPTLIYGDFDILENQFYCPEDYYIDIPTMTPVLKTTIPYTSNKTPLSIAGYGVDSLILSDLPDNISATLLGVFQVDVVDNVLEFTLDYPGTYTLRLLAGFKYHKTFLTIEAT